MRPLLLDEMLSARMVESLRAAGGDALAVAELPHLRGGADPDVLAFAAGEKRVLVTTNIRDFAPLDALWAAQGRTHGGLVFISTRTYPQDRTWLGAIVHALRQRLVDDRWPAPGQVDFL